MQQPQVLVIDLGSQYTLNIGRTLRELGVRPLILSSGKASAWLDQNNRPAGIILSGGSASVYDKDAPEPPIRILGLGVPILGICYGMQWLVSKLGGKVVPAQSVAREYGATASIFMETSVGGLLPGQDNHATDYTVWASHGDGVEKLPPGFKQIAKSPTDTIQGMYGPHFRIWGLLFHPEVTHTPTGKQILSRFVFDICECQDDWSPSDMVVQIRNEVSALVNCANRKAIIAFSGGVDSTTLAAILAPAVNNFLAVCIDTGALREREILEVRENAKAAGVKLKIIKAAREFYDAIGKATDAEIKRRRFKRAYAMILDRVAAAFGVEFIIQASIAPDMIESAAVGGAAKIKSHHNTGLHFKAHQLHPFRELFKYEVRELATQVGLPPSVVNRQPFPGPGLFVRVKGAPVTRERIAIARWADAEVRGILKRTGDYDKISQLVVGLECSRSSGVKGDGRVYGYTALVRPVLSSDFMTASTLYFSEEVWREIDRTLTKHRMIVNVAYFGTSKPPATVEFE